MYPYQASIKSLTRLKAGKTLDTCVFSGLLKDRQKRRRMGPSFPYRDGRLHVHYDLWHGGDHRITLEPVPPLSPFW